MTDDHTPTQESAATEAEQQWRDMAARLDRLEREIEDIEGAWRTLAHPDDPEATRMGAAIAALDAIYDHLREMGGESPHADESTEVEGWRDVFELAAIRAASGMLQQSAAAPDIRRMDEQLQRQWPALKLQAHEQWRQTKQLAEEVDRLVGELESRTADLGRQPSDPWVGQVEKVMMDLESRLDDIDDSIHRREQSLSNLQMQLEVTERLVAGVGPLTTERSEQT